MGLRFTFLESPQANLRLDFGLSPDGLEIYANVQEAFLARQDGETLGRAYEKEIDLHRFVHRGGSLCTLPAIVWRR